MLARTRENQRERRGIVLVLILGVLALMAVIGVTFATFSGQSRVSARNFAQSVNQPQRDELMDYALSQLISDTPDIRSSIRGHSLSRDMFGNDAASNGYLTARPGGAGAVSPYNYSTFYITGVTAVSGTLYDLTTNIVQNDSAIYGYDFTNWILRVSYFGTYSAGPPTPSGTITQTLEVLPVSGRVNGYQASSTSNLVFRVNIAATDQNPLLINLTAGTNTQLPGYYLIQAATNATNLGTTVPFTLDGRWLHAFNGPGMTGNAVYGNFRYNGPLVGAGPNVVGMDEDYDAVDLENWFLAMQSADGSVIIPSFHRPAAIRNDSTIYDWGGLANAAYEGAAPTNWANSASRILRPRQADGHDAATFPDLVPGPNGRITYDVDNDGDGQTDSVWLDLGYPARRNAQGQLFKPLFAFMVIGLNGRIPLNTAGNLAGRVNGIQYVTTPSTQTYGGGSAHAAHLGNSTSEIDPTYALQNCFRATLGNDIGTAGSANGAFNRPSVAGNTALDTQVDNAGIDVRLTQLRNLLTGTRPQPTPGVPGLQPGVLSPVNGKNNFVLINTIPYYMPNSVADPQDPPSYTDTNNNRIYVLRQNPPVAGRWGEPDSIIGGITAPPTAVNPINGYVNLVTDSFSNPIRAGYSYDITDVLQGVARDAADDNYNAFDPYPTGHMGEANDSDMYDAAGALMLPVDRMRRYVTPADINGTGSVTPWTNGAIAGADTLGRVNFSSYYRPPGSPGSIASSLPTTATPAPTPGVIYYPSNATGNNFFYSNGPNNNPNTPALGYATFLPDVTNNPLHAFEFFRLPPVVSLGSGATINASHQITGGTAPNFTFQFQTNAGLPLDQTLDSVGYLFPIQFPTYDYQVNAMKHTGGLNDADEMNLYMPNPRADSPFGPSDLEWLYRQQDVDGTSLTSRLASLAPVSFTNPYDGQRRRRLFALDCWEMNNFAWTNDNPGGNFSTNSQFVWGATPQNASFTQLSTNLGLTVPTPSLAHRDKKINLNYPLPVSNSPEEPVRQKWISDAYQLLKRVLPPKAVDTPEELAQLSQFLTNVIDFRDPDCTMTHFRNPDVEVVLGSNPSTPASPTCTYLAPIGQAIPTGNTAIPLDQYGMEYNPVAINEAMAYSFQGTSGSVNRFFVELVNTLSRSALGVLPAGAFGGVTNPPDVSTLDMSLSNYDLVMTADDPVSRPDPFTGQLLPISTANYYAQLPFNQANSTATPMFSPSLTNPPVAGDVQLTPLYSVGAPASPFATTDFAPNPATPPGPANYFYVIGNADPKSEATPYPTATAYLSTAYDPFTGTMGGSTTVPTGVVPPGYCPNLQSIAVAPAQVTGQPNTMPPNITPLVGGSGSMQYYWVCLRRPANVFAPPQPDPTQVDPVTKLSTYNPMIVVDTMRFPYIEAGPAPGTNQIFSSQRCQPFRGGHAVRLPNDATSAAAALYTPYGYSEQMAQPVTQPGGYGQNGTTQVTKTYYNTIGLINDQPEPWDYFAFNDRDFTSVAELMLVPGCPPGLFTKQFVELAPMPPTTSAISSTPTNFPVPAQMPPNPTASPPTPIAGLTTAPPFASPSAAIQFPAAVAGTAAQPHTYPYLVDKFFYSGYGGTAAPLPDPGTVVGGNAADGWFKMFEFFEVPSQALGAIGSVASGSDFDWARQDTKPGLLNLNLIIDEEVFFSLLGSQSATLSNGTAGTNTDSFSQLLLDFAQLPPAPGSTLIPQIVTQSTSTGAAQTYYPLWDPSLPIQPGVVTNDLVNNAGGAFNGLKAAFAQFLILRHGANQNAAGYWLLYSANPERPFHSLSYPDINYTVMRPATLPPASPTYTGTGGYASATYTGDPGVRNPYIYPWGPASMLATGAANTTFAGGILFSVSGGATANVAMPPPIPARRLFQKPDVYTNNVAVTYPPTPPTSTSTVSNASDSGDPFINVTQTTGALQALSTTNPYVNNGYPNLVWSGNTKNVPIPGVYLGGNTSGADYSQHPYWRSEIMQRVMNLTTVRTHQYAVWITIGFFEVKREGDLLNIQAGSPILAFDILGPEVGAATGQTTRYRGFFLVDRTKLTGFDDTSPGNFQPAVVYRQMIE